MLKQFLEDIGLNEKEADVYLALLQYEHASVVQLADKTGIKRPTVYTILGSLAKKGLISETAVGKKTHYQAEPPERLATFIDRRKLELDEQEKRLKDMIPQLKSLERESGEKPVVQYFEGREGAESMTQLVYENQEGGDTAYLLYSYDLLDDVLPLEDRKKLRNVRLEKHVKLKVLLNNSRTEVVSNDMAEAIKIDASKHPFSCDILLYKDRIRICVLNKKMPGIFIRSKEVADTLRSLFMVAFEGSKKKQ